MEIEFASSGPGQTRAIGAALGRALLRLQTPAQDCAAADASAFGPTACVLLLSGDYGTGKTTLVQGLAAALGISGAVRSPSYLIVKVYDEGPLRLVHADLYRSRGSADVAELGLEDLLEAGSDAQGAARGALLAVEWPGEDLPLVEELPTLRLQLEDPGTEGQRCLRLSWSPDAAGIVSALVEELRNAPAA